MPLPDFSFKHPSSIQVSGPSGCGKTRFVVRILKHALIQPFPTRIVWVYSEWQPEYDNAKRMYPHIEWIHGWNENLYDTMLPAERNLIIIDDQMDVAGNSETLSSLFTKGSHHRNLTIMYLLQNLYNRGSFQRSVSLNTNYNIVFRNARDASQFRTLAHQMQPGNAKWLIEAFNDATSKPYGYLVLDHHPTSERDQSVLTNIFPNEYLTYYSCR